MSIVKGWLVEPAEDSAELGPVIFYSKDPTAAVAEARRRASKYRVAHNVMKLVHTHLIKAPHVSEPEVEELDALPES